jgi:transposase-like protein
MGQKQKVSRRAVSFSAEFRISVVKLFLEEEYDVDMLAEEFGCGKSTIGRWIRLYREHGEASLYTPHACSKKASKKLNRNLQFHHTEYTGLIN